MAKNTICLWYGKDAEAAARFYVDTFPNGSMHWRRGAMKQSARLTR